jgi:shikimate dehydrogenase
MVGVNVTIPHKEKVLPYLDEISPEAKAIGAVNTIHNKEGKLIGYNTDGDGFIESLKKQGGFYPKDKNVFLLGAGGTAYAISFALIKGGIKKLVLVNRTYSKGKALLEHLREIFQDKCQLSLVEFEERNSSFIMSEIDLLINATSLGMYPGDSLLITPEILSPNIFIYDVVYNRKTPFLKLAEEKKLTSLGGLDMLVYQGALSFEIWTGQKAPVEVMKKALMEESRCCVI